MYSKAMHKSFGMRIIGLLAVTLCLPMIAYAALININTASASVLDSLPGIGPTKATAIVEYRTKYGPFKTIDDVQKESGIGSVTFENIKASITVGDTPVLPVTASETQPSQTTTSYKQVQTVEPITSQTTNVQSHAEAVRAPSMVTDLATVGAALPPPASPATGLFHSLWTLAFVGVVLAAGSIFIFI